MNKVDKALDNLEKITQISIGTKLSRELINSATITIKQHITSQQDKLDKLLIPPTADELCKVLSGHYKKEVVFQNNDFYWETVINTKYIVASLNNNGTINVANKLLPHLITLIGRFYDKTRL